MIVGFKKWMYKLLYVIFLISSFVYADVITFKKIYVYQTLENEAIAVALFNMNLSPVMGANGALEIFFKANPNLPAYNINLRLSKAYIIIPDQFIEKIKSNSRCFIVSESTGRITRVVNSPPSCFETDIRKRTTMVEQEKLIEKKLELTNSPFVPGAVLSEKKVLPPKPKPPAKKFFNVYAQSLEATLGITYFMLKGTDPRGFNSTILSNSTPRLSVRFTQEWPNSYRTFESQNITGAGESSSEIEIGFAKKYKKNDYGFSLSQREMILFSSTDVADIVIKKMSVTNIKLFGDFTWLEFGRLNPKNVRSLNTFIEADLGYTLPFKDTNYNHSGSIFYEIDLGIKRNMQNGKTLKSAFYYLNHDFSLGNGLDYNYKEVGLTLGYAWDWDRILD